LRIASVADGDSSTSTPSSGHCEASTAAAVDALIGSDDSASSAGGRWGGASRSASPTSATSAANASAGSARIASPIGARAASSGSDVIATSAAPSGSSGPGMFG
jgi:hypothetical protein